MREIPVMVEMLYRCWVPQPDPQHWPDYLKNEPVFGHGLYSFYQGLCFAIQLSQACRPD